MPQDLLADDRLIQGIEKSYILCKDLIPGRGYDRVNIIRTFGLHKSGLFFADKTNLCSVLTHQNHLPGLPDPVPVPRPRYLPACLRDSRLLYPSRTFR